MTYNQFRFVALALLLAAAAAFVVGIVIDSRGLMATAMAVTICVSVANLWATRKRSG